ncbi:hypothetical protein DY000_02047553 [Brassica cretica]|uniref:Uncharacterized protein n=1 Tax=Brassica cretica TaxID=69181 RepID=A0ABQ7EZL6_BRACR|nr:hypothetical protein DY000_02047553 [Brassica cretica]
MSSLRGKGAGGKGKNALAISQFRGTKSRMNWESQHKDSTSRQRPSQLDTQPVRDPIPFATQLDTKLDSQHVCGPSQRQSVRDRQQPVRDSTISARDLSNAQFQLATRSVPARDD